MRWFRRCWLFVKQIQHNGNFLLLLRCPNQFLTERLASYSSLFLLDKPSFLFKFGIVIGLVHLLQNCPKLGVLPFDTFLGLLLKFFRGEYRIELCDLAFNHPYSLVIQELIDLASVNYVLVLDN